MAKTKKKADLDTTKTSPTLTKKTGFTILEVVIVVAIVALTAAMVLPRIGQRKNEVKSFIRKISVLSRELKSRAKLNNATYRLAIDLGDEDAFEKDLVQQYWVERAQGEVLNDYDPENPPKLEDDSTQEKSDTSSASLFSIDTKMMKKPEVLPSSIRLEDVELSSLEEPVSRGLIYIHYFPSGFADEAAIHIKVTDKIRWTLAVEPTTARVDIIEGHKKLEDLRANAD